MGYQANLLKTIEKGAIYRFRTNGHFYLVTGFTRLQFGKEVDKYTDAVLLHKVEYIKIPQSNPAINQPKVGLRTTTVEQKVKRVRRADDFMDNFFLHERAKTRPNILSVVTPEGDEVFLDLEVLDGDRLIIDI